VTWRMVNPKVAASVVYAGAMFIAVMDLTIVNVALPTIAREFHASAASVAATVIGYQVSLAVLSRRRRGWGIDSGRARSCSAQSSFSRSRPRSADWQAVWASSRHFVCSKASGADS
jgi:MFS family permease